MPQLRITCFSIKEKPSTRSFLTEITLTGWMDIWITQKEVLEVSKAPTEDKNTKWPPKMVLCKKKISVQWQLSKTSNKYMQARKKEDIFSIGE